MQKSQSSEVSNYKWEITVGDEKIELSEKGYQQLMEKEKEGVRLVKIGDKMINPSFIQSAKKIYKQNHTQVSDVLDWSTMDLNSVVTEEVTTSNRDKIMSDIRVMLKEKKFSDVKPQIRDEKHALAIADVWEHLKTHLNEIKPPVKDLNWKVDKSITSHQEGRESHPATYYTKNIDLGDKYDHNFWCEAVYLFCDVCQKNIKDEIRIYNNYENQCVVRKLSK